MTAAFKMKHPIHKDIVEAAKSIGEREERMLKILDDARPGLILTVAVKRHLDLQWDWQRDHQNNNGEAFDRLIKFENVYRRLNHLLNCCGWDIRRMGSGTGEYMILFEQSGSPG